MFCKNCGAEVNDTARFCSKCGFERIHQIQKRKIVEDNNVIIQLKPQFNILYQFLISLLSGFMALIFIAYIMDKYFVILFRYPIIPTVFLIIYIIVKMITQSIQYKKVSYNFYATKVEYIDGFFNKHQKELKYMYVREVTMSKNILQRLCGIGTIRIYSNASSSRYSGKNHNNIINRNGILIHCLKDVDEKYKIVKQIIDEATEDDELI